MDDFFETWSFCSRIEVRLKKKFPENSQRYFYYYADASYYLVNIKRQINYGHRQ
jgi:hypothetical protein